jgi:hypothetical protein
MIKAHNHNEKDKTIQFLHSYFIIYKEINPIVK